MNLNEAVSSICVCLCVCVYMYVCECILLNDFSISHNNTYLGHGCDSKVFCVSRMPGYNPSLMTSRDYIATLGLWYLSHLLCLLNYLSVVWKDWEASSVARPRESFIKGSGVYLWSLILKGRHWCVPLETVSMMFLAVTQALTSLIFREATYASFSPVHSNLFQSDIKKFKRFGGKIR